MTRCWNKSSPIFFPKVAQKVVTSVFTRKVLFFKKLFGDTFVRKFVAKSSKIAQSGHTALHLVGSKPNFLKNTKATRAVEDTFSFPSVMNPIMTAILSEVVKGCRGHHHDLQSLSTKIDFFPNENRATEIFHSEGQCSAHWLTL